MNGIVIALLTYNRPLQAQKTALSLSESISANCNNELLIIENLSTSTLDISCLHSYNFTYILKSPNKGLDNSIIQAICYAKKQNKLIWFICDDDQLNVKNIPLILEEINKSAFNLIYIPWQSPSGVLPEINSNRDAYIRMSFLPTIACNPSSLRISQLRKFSGSNYVHIAVINELLSHCSNINIIRISAGIQTRNITSRFPLFKTFISGYASVLRYKNYLNKNDINQLIFNRVYSSLTFVKNQHISLKDRIKYFHFCIFSKSVSIIFKIKFILKLILSK